MTRSVSASRPITGSSLPSLASWVRSRPYSRRALPSSPAASGEAKPAGMPPKPAATPAAGGVVRLGASSLTALRTASTDTPMRDSASMATPLPSRRMPSSRCSVAM